ncbi:MAG: isocitrate/isopropylmalate dehydrogenase family protein [Erysipelotrichaceae bacterium]
MKKVTIFKGDGIGPEIVEEVCNVLDCLKLPIEFESFEVGSKEYEKNGKLIPDAAYASFEKNKVLLKAPITTPIGKGFRSLNVTLRKQYDLYANIRPARNMPGVKTKYDDIDLIVFRENTEDLYAGIEEQIDQDTVHSIKVITRSASTRIISDAFAYALAHGRKKVTCVHKANIMKLSDGMFLDIFYEVAKAYPTILAEDKIVDNMCMQLVMNPQQFDVLVTENLYGDIISDLTSGLIGGLGLLPSSNIGNEYAMFEAVHGSAPDIAGKHKANPTALLLSACMMLEYLHFDQEAKKIRDAIDTVLTQGQYKTQDLGGNATSEEYTNEIIKQLNK